MQYKRRKPTRSIKDENERLEKDAAAKWLARHGDSKTTSVSRYEAACKAVAEAKTVDEAKDIRDKAVAMAAYQRMAKNHDLEADAVEIRMRATRQIARLMEAQKESVGLNRGSKLVGFSKTRQDNKPTLSSQGIDKNLAHQARTLGALSPEKFESAVADTRDAVKRATRTVVRQADIDAARAGYAATVEQGCTVSDLESLIENGKRFRTIYADPAWEFKAYSDKGKQRAPERHYDTDPLDEIASLPVARLAAEDCTLFLWCVMPLLPAALDIIKAWGFEFKTTAFTWVKQNPNGSGIFTGLGYWTRANAELCLLATRGKPWRLASDVSQIVLAPVGEHSKKPDEVRSRIQTLVPGPYLELYGRKPVAEWTVWGNEIERSEFQAAAAAEAEAEAEAEE